MKFTPFTAILFSMVWMRVEVSGGAPQACCLTVSNTRIQFGNILDYSIQDVSICHIRAVRFHTRKNKMICSDPDSSWAKKVMAILDSRKNWSKEPSKEPFEYYTSTANLIPTTSTTQGMTTTKAGDGCSVSSCYSTIQTGHIPLHLMRALKSRRKKVLRKFQMKIFFKE